MTLVNAEGKPFDANGVAVTQAVDTQMAGPQDGLCTRHEVAVHIARVGQQIANGYAANHKKLCDNDQILGKTLDDLAHEVLGRLDAIEKVLALRSSDEVH